MNKITITIETENAAFQPAHKPEVARILRHLADEFDRECLPFVIRNANGNQVGAIIYDEE